MDGQPQDATRLLLLSSRLSGKVPLMHAGFSHFLLAAMSCLENARLKPDRWHSRSRLRFVSACVLPNVQKVEMDAVVGMVRIWYQLLVLRDARLLFLFFLHVPSRVAVAQGISRPSFSKS